MSERDDDWFEQALREIDDESTAAGDGSDTEEDKRENNTETAPKTETEDRKQIEQESAGGDHSGEPTATGEPTLEDRVTNLDETADDVSVDDASGDLTDKAVDSTAPSARPDAERQTADYDFGGTQAGDGDFSGTQAASDDDFGFGDFGAGETAGGDAPGGMQASGGDEFGFGDFGAGGGGPSQPPSTDFDDDDFESDIDRIKLGIDGLDDMILGGVPDRSLLSVIGSAGTGKTTFGLQFLNQSLSNGERGVFITLEQSEEAVLSTAEEMGWPFRTYQDEGLLSVVVLDPVEMANSLASIRNDVSRVIRDFGAERLVLDSVSLLEMMYDHPARRRSEVFGFTRSLKSAGVTTMLTSEANEEIPYVSKHGMVEYLTDAVFFLQYVRTSNFQETRLAIEIQKIRNANHSREKKPYEITNEGISVYQQANIF